MRTISSLLAILAVVLLHRIAWCFDASSQIDTARQLQELERLAGEASGTSLGRLASLCRSGAEVLPKRIKACRLLSRHGDLQDWQTMDQPLDPADPLGPVLQLVEMRISMRKKGSSEAEVREAEKRRWMSASTASEDAKRTRSTHRDYLLAEIIADYEDNSVPADKLPADFRGHPAAIALRIRADANAIKPPARRLEWLEETLYAKNVYEREAAAALLAKEGEAVLPRILKVIERTLPPKKTPPFPDTTATFSSCLEILAAIGGKNAAAHLETLAKSDIPYVARTSSYYLTWLKDGVKYPISDKRLLWESTADH